MSGVFEKGTFGGNEIGAFTEAKKKAAGQLEAMQKQKERGDFQSAVTGSNLLDVQKARLLSGLDSVNSEEIQQRTGLLNKLVESTTAKNLYRQEAVNKAKNNPGRAGTILSGNRGLLG